jgi:hypothetical protein
MPRDTSDLIFGPERYSEIPAGRLLEAASRGYLGVDHRLLHALLDRPEHSVPDLLRFASEDHEQDPVGLDEVLLDIFRYLRAPEALPFYIEQIRLNPADVPDDLVESVVELGASAVEPLLALLDELEEPGDVPFMLAALRVRDPRILQALEPGLDNDAMSAALSLEIYGDPAAIPAIQAALTRVPNEDARDRQIIQTAIDILKLPPLETSDAPKQFDIWEKYPDEELPVFEILSDDDRLILLERGSAIVRAEAVASYNGSEPPLVVRAKILDLAKNDPEPAVRGACWEALSEISDEPELRRAMLEVLRNPDAYVEEKGGAAIALAERSDNPAVFQAIEALYENQRGRAQALKAMARSLDRRFSDYPPRHLADSDPEIKRQAIWGVGYLRLSSETPRLEALFDDEEYRRDALFAYALASPGDTSPGRATPLLNKIDKLAGGLVPDETELVKIALDQRLMLAGHKPVFFGDEPSEEPEAEPAVSAKIGRNDSCPCGSGKKFKKCCGA